jgi:threonine dehydrogenase-like Zn-dependent dehydrogenase
MRAVRGQGGAPVLVDIDDAPGEGELMPDRGMAEQFRAPSVRLVELPAGLDVGSGALVEPASVSWHGVRVGDVVLEAAVARVAARAGLTRRRGLSALVITPPEALERSG